MRISVSDGEAANPLPPGVGFGAVNDDGAGSTVWDSQLAGVLDASNTSVFPETLSGMGVSVCNITCCPSALKARNADAP
jgi:hypothetical protein